MLKESFVLKENIQHQDQIQEEESLIHQSQADPEAFRPLYEKYFKRIFLFVHHRVGDKDLTSDITSQVFLKALLKIFVPIVWTFQRLEPLERLELS